MDINNITIDWVRHAESCANVGQNDIIKSIESGHFANLTNKIVETYTYHPPLSYKGLQQAIALNEFMKDKNYDVIICSALVRTCMTAMLSLLNKPNTVVYVIPFISELHSGVPFDVTNDALDSYTLKKNIKVTKTWLKENKIVKETDIFPKFDFSILTESEKNNHDSVADPDKFFKLILPELIKKINKTDTHDIHDIHICAFSHGRYINEIVKHVTHNDFPEMINNTSVIQINDKLAKKIYDPPNISLDTQVDTCIGLKKYLHQINVDNKTELTEHYSTDITDKVQSTSLMTGKQINELNESLQVGGQINKTNYKHKYLKYKRKYLQLLSLQ